MTDKLSPADAKWVADARRDFIKRVSKTVGSDHERLTDEQLEALRDGRGPDPDLHITAIATELIALRAERVKLVGALNLAVSRGCDHCSESIRLARAALAQPAESGATAEDWGKIASDVMVEMECAVDGGEEVRILASALATAAGAKP